MYNKIQILFELLEKGAKSNANLNLITNNLIFFLAKDEYVDMQKKIVQLREILEITIDDFNKIYKKKIANYRKLKEARQIINKMGKKLERADQMTKKTTKYFPQHLVGICTIYHNSIKRNYRKITWYEAVKIYNEENNIITKVFDTELPKNYKPKRENYSKEVIHWALKASKYYRQVYLKQLKNNTK
jgi:hypothetical protein